MAHGDTGLCGSVGQNITVTYTHLTNVRSTQEYPLVIGIEHQQTPSNLSNKWNEKEHCPSIMENNVRIT
jgi:hypothetical protein